MSKVIVTGANGFLGSWITRTLIEHGHDVKALVRKNGDHSELKNISCELVYGDVTDSSSLISGFKGIEYIFHAAGLIEYKKSMFEKMRLVNVEGTRNVIEACQKNNVQKLIHISSVVAVGASFDNKTILNEESAYNVAHLHLGYFETKKAAEDLVKKSFQEKKIDTVILSPSTIYGSGDAKKGSRKTQVKVAQGRFPIYTQGGVNVVAVEDVVAGIISAWKNGRSGERYILSSENITLKQLFTIIAEEAGVPAPHICIPPAAMHLLGFIGDSLRSLGIEKGFSSENAWTSTLYHWFSCDKAKKEIGFNPRPARYAISKSVQWMKENGLLNTAQ